MVISGSEGFQAQTYWLYDTAIKKSIPIIIASTKMDIRNSNIDKINNEIKKLGSRIIPIVKTSAKEVFGIEELVNKISIYVKKREDIESLQEELDKLLKIKENI